MSEPTCRILRGNEEIYVSDRRGIAPLIALIDSGADVKKCVAYDKIVGKAAALLYVLMDIGEVHAGVMSESGAAVLRKYGIPYTYETLTERIINRAGDGICPMEQTVGGIDEPAAALTALKEKVKELQRRVS